MNTDLYYLIQEPKNPSANNPAILLLHGFGSNEEDLFSFASELPEEYYIISARAPQDLQPYGHAWFPIVFDYMGNKTINPQEVFEAREILKKFIEDLLEKYPIDPKNFNLVGFSQGAILSYLLAFSYPEKFNKVVALSGYFKPEFMSEQQDVKAYEHLQFFVSHGLADQVIAFEDGKEATKVLEKLQIPYEFHQYPIGHGVSPQNFFDFKKFLEKK